MSPRRRRHDARRGSREHFPQRDGWTVLSAMGEEASTRKHLVSSRTQRTHSAHVFKAPGTTPSHIHNWLLFSLWLHPFILSAVISPLISSSILGTYPPGEFIFQCPIFLPFHSVAKNPPADAEDKALIPGSGRSSGEGNGNPLQSSCLENPRDGGACWAAIYGVAQSWTQLMLLSSSSSSSS